MIIIIKLVSMYEIFTFILVSMYEIFTFWDTNTDSTLYAIIM